MFDCILSFIYKSSELNVFKASKKYFELKAIFNGVPIAFSIGYISSITFPISGELDVISTILSDFNDNIIFGDIKDDKKNISIIENEILCETIDFDISDI